MIRPTLYSAALLGIIACGSSADAQNFNGTCRNVYYQGPRLVATCLNAFGQFNTSSIDVRTCPPQAIGNGNGNLVCTVGSGGGGGYGGGYGYGRRGYGY